MNYHKLYLILAFLLCICNFTKAQTFAESKLTLISEDRLSKPIEYYISNSVMLLNTATGEFILNTDLSELKTGNAKLDSALMAQGEEPLIFKGNISENILTYSQTQNDERMYSMPGQLNSNGNVFSCEAQFDPINLADKNETKSYRMDFKLTFDSNKLNVKPLENSFSKQIVLEIRGGKLNIQN